MTLCDSNQVTPTPCKIEGRGDISFWPDLAPVPSDPHMQCIASALYQFSKFAEDPNDAFFAFLYYHHIGSIDMEFASCLQIDDYFTQLVACAIDTFQVEEPGDHVYVDDVKKRLSEVVEGYTPIYGWIVPGIFLVSSVECAHNTM